MACQEQGTVTDFAGFNAEDDCEKLENIRTPLAVIDVICHRSNAQRQELKVKYKSMYGKDLTESLRIELSGDFRQAILFLLLTPADLDATCVHNAVEGLVTDEAAIIEVLTSRSNEELKAMKMSYKKLFGERMEDMLAYDLEGDFKRIMVSLTCRYREAAGQGPVSTALAANDAKRFYDAVEKNWETDKSIFNSIFAVRSLGQLREMYKEYEKISENSIETVITKGMSGFAEEAYLSIVEVSKDLVGYFVSRLYKSMTEDGTDENTLTRVMVSRSEVDMQQIKACFQAKYGKSLYSFIEGGTSGDYKQTMLALCRDQNQEGERVHLLD